MTAEWPQLPQPGDLIRLPLPVPPTLLAAAGYRGDARYVALFWSPYGDELMLCDGAITHTGWWPAWTTLAHHQLGHTILRPYQFGSSEAEAVHWLLADRHEHTLDVGAERDVRQFLATQPSELAAAAEILGADELQQVIVEQLANATPPATGDALVGLQHSRELLAELQAWLDAVLEQTLKQ